MLTIDEVELAHDWIGALKSGKYQQCHGEMAIKKKRCAIGVLEEIKKTQGNHVNLCLISVLPWPFHWIEDGDVITRNDDYLEDFETIADFIDSKLNEAIKKEGIENAGHTPKQLEQIKKQARGTQRKKEAERIAA